MCHLCTFEEITSWWIFLHFEKIHLLVHKTDDDSTLIPGRSVFNKSSNVRIKGPLGKHALVQSHKNGVLLGDRLVHDDLHVTMRAKRFLDMTSPSMFRLQLNRFEPINILTVKKHETNNG